MKDKSRLIFLISLLLILSLFIHSYILWKGGVSSLTVKLKFYVSPISGLFILLAYNLYRSLKNRLVITESGLSVEDFSPVEFPWEIIRSASVKSQTLPRGGECSWLVLRTENDSNYINPKIRKLNKLLGIDGIPVCNLSTYNIAPEKILNVINMRVKNT